jgi:hypothetical protein
LILLDENTLRSQREFLEARRLPVRKVGLDWGREGMTDEEVVAQLHKMRRVTLFTRDLRLYSRHLCHPRYCIAGIGAPADQVTAYVIRFLRHRFFRTHALRMGKVVKLQPSGILYWTRNSSAESFAPWR